MGDGQPRLLDQVRDRKQLQHPDRRGVCQRIRRFVLHHNKRHSCDMGAAEVESTPSRWRRVGFVPVVVSLKGVRTVDGSFDGNVVRTLADDVAGRVDVVPLP
jgi:hypothetical protein